MFHLMCFVFYIRRRDISRLYGDLLFYIQQRREASRLYGCYANINAMCHFPNYQDCSGYILQFVGIHQNHG